jgi:transmembrane sensor
MPDPVSDVEIQRGWGAIESALDTAPRPKRRVWARVAIATGLLAAAAAIAFFVYPREPERTAQGGALLEAGPSPLEISMSDGSEVEVAPRARVFVVRDDARAQRVRLDRGTAIFDVTPRRHRTFEVLAGGAVIRVLGTRFTVSIRPGGARNAARLIVAVEHGHVRVEMGAQEHDVLGGGRLSLALPLPEVPEQAAPVTRTEDAEEIAVETPLARPSRRERAEERDLSIEELFGHAQSARRAGRNAEAADLYAQLAREYPGDRRAGLASFEQGRILLDEVGDPSGAARALRRASATAGPHREDARARLVEAYERLGDLRMCRRAQQTYLARHPRGVHAAIVRERCGP